MKIGNFELGKNKTFIIAEIGNNHNGSLEKAMQMVDLAVNMNVDCVKFQMRHLNQVYRKRSLEKSGEDLGTEYIIDLLKRFELTVEEHESLANYCFSKGIQYMCTPWDLESIKVLEKFGVKSYKVASADLTNLPLIDKLTQTNKPLILSTGMNNVDEVQTTVNFLNKKNAEYVLLHCNSTYPAPFQDINLKWMKQLKKIHKYIGYSGHERGIAVSLAAVSLGANVIERHFTLDRNMEGPDHAASLEFLEFKSLVNGIREIEEALGNGESRVLSQGEMINRENLGKSLVSSKFLSKGTKISSEHIKVLSPGQGLSPQNYEKLLGVELNRDMEAEEFFFESDLEGLSNKPQNYNFIHPWGIPVRYHDFEKYEKMVKPDFFEFHLSYSDMDLNPKNFIKKQYDCGFVVHAPELFKDSRLMDLTSFDQEYLEFSIQETQKVINITRELKKYFPNEVRPMIVANIGGFTMDQPMTKSERLKYYNQFENSLAQLDMEGVEIIPQTMAPFPWHFGGQRYQNLFLEIDEIEFYCKKLNLRMCFDVSHSMLACNHLNFNFYEFAKRVAPFTGHLHLGDAKGLNGEGLQIGDGEIDFKKLGYILNNECPKAYFIPEIWQGHKNEGSGFWLALDKLNGLL